MRFRLITDKKVIVLYILIFALMIVGIFAFSIHHISLQRMRQIQRIEDVERVILLSRSAIAFVTAQIKESLENPKSELSSIFFSEQLATGTDLPLDSTPLINLAKGYREGGVQVSARVKSVSPLSVDKLGVTTGGFDPVERNCEIEICSFAYCNGVERTLNPVQK